MAIITADGMREASSIAKLKNKETNTQAGCQTVPLFDPTLIKSTCVFLV